MTKTERNKLKKLLREVMLKRDNHTCQAAERGDCGGPLQTSHIYPVGKYRKMAFMIDNVKTMCQRHHLYWWHKHPIEATEWISVKIPLKRLEKLKELANTIIREPLNYEEIKAELEKLDKEYS